MSKATRRFIVNKVLEMLITLVVVTLISFLLVRLSPIDPAEAYARRSFAAFSFTDEQMEALREDMGLNDPLPVQYVTWVRDALHLDFGKSFVSGQPVFEKVTTAIGITVTIVLISAVIQAVFILLFGCLCYLTRKRMIGHIGDRMKYMPMGYFNSHSLGNLTSTVTTTISDVENNAPSVLITVIHGFIHVTVITIVMFFFDWRIGLLACLGIALFLLCNSVLQKKSQEVSPKRQAAQEDLVGATLEYIQGMGIVKSFNLGGKSNQKMKQAIEESRARNTKLETVFGPYGMVQLFVLRLASVAIMFCSILFYLQGSMTLVYCLLMCVASFLIFSELEAAGGKSFALRLIESSIDKVNAIDDTPVMDLSGKDIAPKDTTIELQNVGFSYGDHRILNHVNLTIPAKTTTAIVGPSGSGKTTLCSLITRFWDVDEGCIKLGGTDIREYKLDSLLSNISMVFQNVFLFADSIENNIKFGKPDATHEEVVRAAKSACCHDFIMALPNGYDTVIGESGATLSGGEKQRISIARAILKDTPIIILDEATSSVDPENEAELQQAIEKLTEDKTVIIIAHRLKTVRNAQQIVVIANGGIAQRGTHQELMTQPGIYADFVNIREKAVNWKISSSKIQQ